MSAPRKPISGPAFEKYYTYLLFAFVGFCIADVLILNYRDLMLPTQTPPSKPRGAFVDTSGGRAALGTITSRNIFASNGQIPDPLIAAGDSKEKRELPPIPTTLPLKLIGTLVHSNPDKSLAAIEIKGKNQTLSYQTKKEIEGMGILERVERQKIFIRNNQSGRLEYLEMEKTTKVSFGVAKANSGPVPEQKGDIKNLGANNFELRRADLLKYTSDLSSILMQARMVPARKPTGEIYGFRFVDIQPGSIYTQMGFMPMDVITSVNGTPVTSPAQAMELYQAMKSTANSVKVGVERNGKNEQHNYNIVN